MSNMDMYKCVYVCVFVFLLCGAVSCRVSRVVVGWVVGCGAVDMSLSWWSVSLCRGPSHCVVIEKYRVIGEIGPSGMGI